MTVALEGMSGQQHDPTALCPRERPGTHFTWGWVGSRAVLDGRKISSPPGFFVFLNYNFIDPWVHKYNGIYLSNVLLTDYCPCVRIPLFVCYRRPLEERRYGGTPSAGGVLAGVALWLDCRAAGGNSFCMWCVSEIVVSLGFDPGLSSP